MAATVVNGPGTPVIVRNKPVDLGTLTATTQAVQFTVAIPTSAPNGNDLLTLAATGAITTGAMVLEASLDGGTKWFSIQAGSQAATLQATGQIGGDAAVSAAASFNISGLQGALFRGGVSGTITSNPDIWALLG